MMRRNTDHGNPLPPGCVLVPSTFEELLCAQHSALRCQQDLQHGELRACQGHVPAVAVHLPVQGVEL
ncbi:hypothetical protein SRABI91_02988 [Rhodococcoides fascians]|nr:hypothetical protein SRABI91_02988 [Rhodococcus fascians]